MDLLVDIGNTRLRWCCAEHGRCSPTVVQAYDSQSLAALLEDHWASLPAPRRVVAANVAGEAVARRLDEAVHDLWGLHAGYVRAAHEGGGVVNGYVNPTQLGADRWAALMAAHRLYAGTKFIVDCGTAVTVDVLGGDGRHRGGLILPGLTMMRRALLGGTSDLYINDEHGPSHPHLAHETSDAIKAGTLRMLTAALDGIAQDVASGPEGPIETKIVTGGNAPQLLPMIGADYTHEPELVLKGLMILAGDGA